VATVVVAGSSSRAGKTALAETILRSLGSRAAAVKFTTTDDVFEKCPRGTACIVCDIDVPFKVVRDDATLNEKGTDTARLKDATRGPVLWTIARKSVAELAWQATVRLLDQANADAHMKPGGDDDGLVIEGSTIADLCAPDFTFFVVHPFLGPSRWKKGTRELVGRADCVVINRQASETREPSAEVMAALCEARPYDLRVADVLMPLDTWAGDLLPRLQSPRP
jgi:molybdopterin-guanine dinucleotide biosynthesis protein